MVWKKNPAFWKCNLTICTIRIKENRQDFLYHAGPLSYNSTEMHWKWTFQGQKLCQKHPFPKILLKIFSAKLVMQRWNNSLFKQRKYPWVKLCQQVSGFWHACFWFFHFAWFLQILTLNYSKTSLTKHFFKVILYQYKRVLDLDKLTTCLNWTNSKF